MAFIFLGLNVLSKTGSKLPMLQRYVHYVLPYITCLSRKALKQTNQSFQSS